MKILKIFFSATIVFGALNAANIDANLIEAAKKEGVINSVGMPDTWANWKDTWDDLARLYSLKHSDTDMSSAQEIANLKAGAAAYYQAQREALAMSDRIILMQDGKIAQNSDALELYHKPKNKFVASFIGSYNILSSEALLNLVKHDFKRDLAIRPETIEITKNGSIQAVVKEKLGNIIRYSIDAKGISLKVDTLNHSLNSLYEVGDSVFLEIHLEMIKELDDLSI